MLFIVCFLLSLLGAVVDKGQSVSLQLFMHTIVTIDHHQSQMPYLIGQFNAVAVGETGFKVLGGDAFSQIIHRHHIERALAVGQVKHRQIILSVNGRT